jgi:hypothetical protein
MPVNESELLERELTENVGMTVDSVYMNGVYPERFTDAEAERLAELPEASSAARAAARAAISEHRRARIHREQLERLQRLVSAPVKTLPFIFEPELGPGGLHALAAEV